MLKNLSIPAFILLFAAGALAAINFNVTTASVYQGSSTETGSGTVLCANVNIQSAANSCPTALNRGITYRFEFTANNTGTTTATAVDRAEFRNVAAASNAVGNNPALVACGCNDDGVNKTGIISKTGQTVRCTFAAPNFCTVENNGGSETFYFILGTGNNAASDTNPRFFIRNGGTANDTSESLSIQIAVCGNNSRQGLVEACDGTDLAGQTCQGMGFAGGTLSCQSDCLAFNTSACIAQVCGNNVREGTEACDGTALNGETCQSQGFFTGGLSCNGNCTGYDNSACTNCGNGTVNQGETCDGANLDNHTCQTQGYAGGALSCAPNCQSFDTSACTSAVCGNQSIEGNEACDGPNLDSQTCQTQGFTNGSLACNGSCTGFDTSNCFNTACGNNAREGTEACDGADLASQTCVTQGFDSGTIACISNCAGFDTGACTSFSCGNNTVEGAEICDGTDLQGKTCQTQNFSSGTLSCMGNCTGFDTGSCSNQQCGNGTKEGSEECDGTDLGGQTCNTLGYTGGSISCAPGCDSLDTTQCTTSEICGNQTIAGPEACDGQSLANQTCASQGFESGTLSCAQDCLSFDTSYCTGTSEDEKACGIGCCGGGTCDADYGEDYGSCRPDCKTPRELFFEILSPLAGQEYAAGDTIPVMARLKADSIIALNEDDFTANGPFGEIQLLDNGEPPDETPGDGVYSGFFEAKEINTPAYLPLFFSATVEQTPGKQKWGYQFVPAIAVNYATSKKTYAFGDEIKIRGTVSRKKAPAALEIQINIIALGADGSTLLEKKLVSGTDGSFSVNFQTSNLHPAGEWIINVTAKDEFESFGFASKKISAVQPLENEPVTIFFEEDFSSASLQRGKRVKITIKATDEYNEHVENAGVSMQTPDGKTILFEETQNQTYTLFYTAPFELPLGRQKFTARIRKESPYTVFSGTKEFFLNIEEAAVKVELVEPKQSSFNPGDQVNIVIKVSYEDGNPVAKPEFTAMVNGMEILFSPVDIGVYSSSYNVTQGDSGRTVLDLKIEDEYKNFSESRIEWFVSNEPSINHYIKKYPLELTAIIAAFTLVATFTAMFTGRKLQQKNMEAKIEGIKTKLKSLDEQYIDYQSIDKQDYEKMSSRLDAQRVTLESKLEALKKKK